MTADPTRTLAPLDSALVEHLTKKLGPPESFLLAIDGGRDIRADGWIIGRGELDAGSTGSVKRGTTVTIRLTTNGLLVTNRRSWKEGPDVSGSESTGRINSCPQTAFEWLMKDGNGKLGPASKAAWVQACRNVPAMTEFEFERA